MDNGTSEAQPTLTSQDDLQELKDALLRIEHILKDTPRRGEVYTKNEIDNMVMERNNRLTSVEQQLADNSATNEKLIKSFGDHVRTQIEEIKVTVSDTLRGFSDTQARQQRDIDSIISALKESNQQIGLVTQMVEGWKPIHETNQHHIQDITQRMGKIETRQGEIEAEERDAAGERNEINHRFELVTSTIKDAKSQMVSLSNTVVSYLGQLGAVTEYVTAEKQRKEINRKRWDYLKKIFTSKPVIAFVYPPTSLLLSWIGVQVGNQLKLQEFVQTIFDVLEHLIGSL